MTSEVLRCRGPAEKLDICVPSERRWGLDRERREGSRESEKENQKKGRQMEEQEQGRVCDKVIKGEEDKANWAGRSDNQLFCYETLKWKQNPGRVKEKAKECPCEKLDCTPLSHCNKCDWRLADKSGDKSADVGYTFSAVLQ